VLLTTFVGGPNIAGTDAPPLQAIVEKANVPSLSQKERAALFAQADQLITDSLWSISICNAPNQWLTTSKVQNVDKMTWASIFDVRYLSMAK
jgi:ABC-type transport system substrate-binding protein